MFAAAHRDALRRPGLAATLVVLGAALAAPRLAQLGVVERPATPAPSTLPACIVGDRIAGHAGHHEWERTLLDTEYRLPADYAPPDLVEVGAGGRTVVVRSFLVPDLRTLLAAAGRDGVRITLNSGYRSYAEQAQIFGRFERARGLERALGVVARAGHSEHQLGTTVDFAGDYSWLAANAWRFGFVMSYPPARSPSFTCYRPEPWHYRYFGHDKAAAIHASGLSPREYLWLEQEQGP